MTGRNSIPESPREESSTAAQLGALPDKALPLNPHAITETTQGGTHSLPETRPEPWIWAEGAGASAALCGPRRDRSDISDEDERSPWARKTVLTFGRVPHFQEKYDCN
jgi:hypothetical protein